MPLIMVHKLRVTVHSAPLWKYMECTIFVNYYQGTFTIYYQFLIGISCCIVTYVDSIG